MGVGDIQQFSRGLCIWTPSKMSTKQYNVFLDLDSTCISSLEVASTPMSLIENLESHGIESLEMEGIFHVTQRPGLQSFLDFLFENFNVSVWTAASKAYAEWIIPRFITGQPNGKPTKGVRELDFFLWGDQCEMCQTKYGAETTKDLSIFWNHFTVPGYDHSNTIILDDNCVAVWDGQECSCMLIRGYEADDLSPWDDDELRKAKAHLIRIKNGQTDGMCPVGDGMYTTPTEIGELYGDVLNARDDTMSVPNDGLSDTSSNSGSSIVSDIGPSEVDMTVLPSDSISQVG